MARDFNIENEYDEDSVAYRFFGHAVFLRCDFKLKSQVVNWNLVFTCVVLCDTRQEGLSEVESGYPEYMRRSTVDPFLYIAQNSFKFALWNDTIFEH